MLLEIVDLKRFHILNYMSEHITMFDIEHFSFLKKILFILREREREKERERNISVWLPLTRLLLGTWPATQACVLTGNRTSNPLVRRLVLSPLSHTSQSMIKHFKYYMIIIEK